MFSTKTLLYTTKNRVPDLKHIVGALFTHIDSGLLVARSPVRRIPIYCVSTKSTISQIRKNNGNLLQLPSVCSSRHYSASSTPFDDMLLKFDTVAKRKEYEDDNFESNADTLSYKNEPRSRNAMRTSNYEPSEEELDSQFRADNRSPYDREARYSRLNKQRLHYDRDEYSPNMDFAEDELYGDSNTGLNFDKYDNIPVEVTGNEPPQHIESFSDLNVLPQLMKNIKRCNYSNPTPVQKYALPMGLQKRDVMSCAQTGSGKTAAFLIPMIQHVLTEMKGRVHTSKNRTVGPATQNPFGLIIAPTRELASQIFKETLKFSHRTIARPCYAYGGASINTQIANIERGCHILVATPGRLIDLMEREVVSFEDIRCVVLDEADRMLDMGFGPQIKRVLQNNMPRPIDRHTMMFSATFPKEIQVLARSYLHDYLFLTVGRIGSTSENICQNIVWATRQTKKDLLVDLLKEEEPRSKVLVFVETKRQAEYLSNYLRRDGYKATTIHGDRSQRQRETALNNFKDGRTPVLVATSVAARGLDIPNVAHVVNYDMPAEIDDYVHRIGRTGRVGNTGKATAFFNFQNLGLTSDLISLLEESKQDVPDWLVQMKERQQDQSQRKPTRNFSKFRSRDYRQHSSKNDQWDSDRAPTRRRTRSTVMNEDYDMAPTQRRTRYGDEDYDMAPTQRRTRYGDEDYDVAPTQRRIRYDEEEC